MILTIQISPFVFHYRTKKKFKKKSILSLQWSANKKFKGQLSRPNKKIKNRTFLSRREGSTLY